MASWTFVDPPKVPKHLRRAVQVGDTINGRQIASVDQDDGTWVEASKSKSRAMCKALDEQSQGPD